MRTFKLTLQYIGTQYCGWQIQPNGITVQEILQKILHQTLGEDIKVIASGRTDSGVHALAQVAHFQTKHSMEAGLLLKALNGQLPEDIAVSELIEVASDFHALKSAKEKTYLYLIFNSARKYPFLTPYTWRQYGEWQLDALSECLGQIEGLHDFRSFCAADSTAKTTERRILSAQVKTLSLSQLGSQLGGLVGLPDFSGIAEKQETPELLAFSFRGAGFLKHMIRNLIGTLRDVGLGKISPADFKAILDSKDRRQAGITAPPQGLFLVKVEY